MYDLLLPPGIKGLMVQIFMRTDFLVSSNIDEVIKKI